MNVADIEALKKRLMERREELLAVEDSAKEAVQTVELDQTRVGRVSRMDAMQSQAMARESERRRLLALQRIESALERIENDEYGYCVACGELIGRSRLDADPGVLLCLDCASRAENRQS